MGAFKTRSTRWLTRDRCSKTRGKRGPQGSDCRWPDRRELDGSSDECGPACGIARRWVSSYLLNLEKCSAGSLIRTVCFLLRLVLDLNYFSIGRDDFAAASSLIAEMLSAGTECKTIKLPHLDPCIFSLYCDPRNDGVIASKTKVVFDPNLAEYTLLCKLYGLCHRLGDVWAKNVTVDAVRGKYEHEVSNMVNFPSSLDVSMIYRLRPGIWGARSLVVDMYCSRATAGSLNSLFASAPFCRAFLNDLAAKAMYVLCLLGSGARGAPGGLEMYHEGHSVGQPAASEGEDHELL